MVHGLYTIARAKRFTGSLTQPSLILLRRAAVTSRDTVVRRLALLTLAAAGGLDSATAMRTARDRDDETRRMTLRGAGALPAPLRATLVRQALADPSMIVRIEAIAASRLGVARPDCAPILTATRDRELYVSLTAIDSLAIGCADAGATANSNATTTPAPPPRASASWLKVGARAARPTIAGRAARTRCWPWPGWTARLPQHRPRARASPRGLRACRR